MMKKNLKGNTRVEEALKALPEVKMSKYFRPPMEILRAILVLHTKARL